MIDSRKKITMQASQFAYIVIFRMCTYPHSFRKTINYTQKAAIFVCSRNNHYINTIGSYPQLCAKIL